MSIFAARRWNKRFDPADFGNLSVERLRDSRNDKMPDIAANRDQYEFLSWDMEPGDCLVHHSLAVHGAGGNRSATQRRRAISTRWFGDQAYYRPHGSLQPDVVGLKPGARITSPMFPAVPGAMPALAAVEAMQ